MNTFIEDVARDIRHGWRLLRRTRGFSITAVLVLAVCIGANSAVFSTVNALLLRPLPYPNADRLFQVVITNRAGHTLDTSIPKFNAWREQLRSGSAIAAYQSSDPGVNLLGGDAPQHLSALHVSQQYFAVFGARALHGRTFKWSEDRHPAPPVVVLSHGFWMRHFGGDRSAIGRMLPLGAQSHEIVGVLDAGFRSDPPVDVYLPLQPDPFSLDHANVVRVVGRLKGRRSVLDAAREVMSTGPAFREKFPLAVGPWEEFWALPLRDAMVGDVKPALRVLSGAVLFVLLIGCANVAALLLARGHRRRREIATRTALGAGRGRVVRQLLTESALLTCAGGLLGLGFGVAGLRGIVRLGADSVPTLARDGAATMDPNVVWFTVAMSLMTGILFGVLPALTASRVDLSAAFKEAGTAAETGWRGLRLQSVLVTVEMTLAIVLLIGCGLMLRTAIALRDVDRGFDATRVVALDTSLTGSSVRGTADLAAMERSARLGIAPLPGVVAFAASRALPLERGFALPFTIPKRPVAAPFEGTVNWRSVSEGYFDVFRIALLRGRAFTLQDDAASPPVVIINAAMARKYWQRTDPVGERITIGTGAGPEFRDEPRQIVGVVADPRDPEANRDPEPLIYVPLGQVPDAMTARNNRLFPLTWVVRTSIDPRGVTAALHRELRRATGLPVARTRTMADVLAGPSRRAAFQVALLSVFAGLALLLAVIGFYGLMSYSVQQRTQEIGIRMALGAASSDVRTMVLTQGLRLAGAGVVLGIAAALGLTRVMQSLVFGVTTYDPMVFIGVAGLLSTIALIAALIPAHRATQVNPLDAVRSQ